MSQPDHSRDANALRGFTELFQDRLRHVPAPATAAMAQGIFAAAGMQQWDRWPDRVEFERETIELPDMLHNIVDGIRREIEDHLAAGDTGQADATMLQAIVTRLRNFPPAPTADTN